MTREEEIQEAAKEFVFGDKPETSDFFDKVMIDCFYCSAKWADKTMLEKACEWLENIDFASEYFYDDEGFFENAILVEEFKKAMEE